MVPDPLTLTDSVPEMPVPLLAVKFAATTPETLSLNVTVKTGDALVSAAALLARTIEVTVGAVWSTVTARLDDALPVFPAVSVAVAVMVWLPTAKVVAMVNVPFVAVPVAPEMATPALRRATVLPASAVPVTDTEVTLVVPSEVEVPVSVAVVRETPVGALGAVVSMMIVWPVYSPDPSNAGRVSVALFPAASAIVPVSALVDW